MNDRDLQQSVLDELRFDPQLNAEHIGVTAEQGVVTLTGHVSSFAEKLAAERVARRVRGVRAIAEEIEVRLPHHSKTADDEIAKRAADLLALNSSIPQGAIDITVQDGWVKLAGEVDWQFQRAEAQDQVGRLSGVRGIINNIALARRSASPDISRQIKEALLRNAQFSDAGISVTVLQNGHVILDGDVHGWEQCKGAEQIAWSVPGVGSVDNRLAVI